jgi:hypothetical protein
LIWISFMVKDIEYFFRCLLDICTSSLENCSFVHLLIGLPSPHMKFSLHYFKRPSVPFQLHCRLSHLCAGSPYPLGRLQGSMSTQEPLLSAHPGSDVRCEGPVEIHLPFDQHLIPPFGYSMV